MLKFKTSQVTAMLQQTPFSTYILSYLRKTSFPAVLQMDKMANSFVARVNLAA